MAQPTKMPMNLCTHNAKKMGGPQIVTSILQR